MTDFPGHPTGPRGRPLTPEGVDAIRMRALTYPVIDRDDIADLCGEIERLRAALEDAKTDTERLDGLEAMVDMNEQPTFHIEGEAFAVTMGGTNSAAVTSFTGETLREAIDKTLPAARTASGEPSK